MEEDQRAFQWTDRPTTTLMENRNGLVVQTEVTQADGHAERKAALAMVNRHAPGSTRRLTLGAELPADAPPVQAPLATATTAPIS